MPNIKSVIKDVKKSRQNHLRNISAKSAMKTFIKKAKTAVESKDKAAEDAVKLAVSAIDKTAERGIIHKKDRKSTRLNSSHGYISYAVFCLKKKNNKKKTR